MIRLFTLPLVTGALLAVAPCASAQSGGGAVAARREPHHHLAFEDATLRVLRVRVPPHDTTLLHEHAPDYFWIALGRSEVVNAKPGTPDAVIKSEDLSIHYTPGKFAHVARNPGAKPFDNITVELLGSQTHVRNLCEAALPGQPLACEGATPRRGVNVRPAFMTDQLRVDLVELPAGKSLQASGKARAWLIALDTADTRSRASLVVHDGSGQWSGGVYRTSGAAWSVANRSQRPRRLIMVTARGAH
ncbi:MAG TPA: hypothetical protein VH277_10155 [Gemmatimonadaceae bacterium]|jgi:hypothetical protein|nr:hypothetical protein [Gemmatimonadaceae bacterium]